MYAARGCGRSYGLDAGVFGFSTPGHSRSGLFEAVEKEARSREKTEVFALLTDVGNDILYGPGVERIAAWVEEIAGRLLRLGARIGVTSLPVASVEAIPAWKYRLLRPLYYPFHPMRQEEATRQVRQLQERIEHLGEEKGIKVLPVERSWYRFDHFHLRRSARRHVFSTWLDQLLEQQGGSAPPATAGAPRLSPSRLALRYHLPAEYFLFRRPRRRPQLGMELAPGARLYSY
jgi:hypothetical protein